MITARLQQAFDESAGGRRLRSFVGELRGRTAPAHWTNLFGVVTVACLAVLFVTGVILMFFYAPSSDQVIYHGSFVPLKGTEVSKAFASTLGLSFDVRGGLLLRQAHHWAALLLPAAIIVQLVVAFFTSSYRKPRQWAWVLLFLALIAALAAGWSGYALPDDMLSGTGLRIVQGIVLGIPFVGTWISALLFGGGFPGRIIENLYPIHLLVSIALVVVVAVRARSTWVHGVQGFPGRARVAMPTLVRRAIILFVAVCGILTVISATVTVSPVWLYGPSDPANASAGSQPDWYTGFLDGALRLVPPGWEVQVFGGTVSLAILVPLAVIGAFLAAVLVYPFVEGWVLKGRGGGMAGEFLDRPRTVPTRTAIGVAGMAVYGVLWGAASSDVIATQFGVSLDNVTEVFRVLLLVGPVIAFAITRRVCLGLQRADRELLLHGHETGRIVRLPGGEYIEMHQRLSAGEVARLADPGYRAFELRPDARGRIRVRDRARATLSRLLLRDRLAPVTGSIGIAEAREDTDSAA